jgi:CRP/FNR family transcriptional regulator, cyclic AMP receptor protein
MGATTDNDFLGLLDEAERSALVSNGQHRRVRNGELLFKEGDDASQVIVVLQGVVKIWISAPGGRQVILDLADQGSLLGELSAIDGAPRSASAAMLEDGEVLAIPMSRFRAVLDEHPRSASLCCSSCRRDCDGHRDESSSSARTTPLAGCAGRFSNSATVMARSATVCARC